MIQPVAQAGTRGLALEHAGYESGTGLCLQGGLYHQCHSSVLYLTSRLVRGLSFGYVLGGGGTVAMSRAKVRSGVVLPFSGVRGL